MQPKDLRSASSCDWPWNDVESCGARAADLELAWRAKKKDNAETQRTLMVLKDDVLDWRSLFIIAASLVGA
jgi:hypothetical protein